MVAGQLWITNSRLPSCWLHPASNYRAPRLTKEGDHIQMKKIRAAAFICTALLAIGAFAFQSAGSQSSPSQMPTSPSQQTTQPSPTTPPSQETPSTTPGQQAPQPG